MRLQLVLALALAAVAAGSFSYSGANFTAASSNAGNSFGSAPDWVAPSVLRAAIVRDGATSGGVVASGASYYLYAEVAESGNPASGIASVAADLTGLSAGAGAVPLAAGSWSIGGQGYGYRAGPLVADALLPAGPIAFSFSLSDNAGNAGTTGGFDVAVDDVAPAAVDVQATGGGAIPSRVEAGDAVTFTFSERIEPSSVVPGWDGAAPAPIVVRLNRASAGSGDTLLFYGAGNTTALGLGTVDLGRNDYTNANITFGAGGTPSSIAHTEVTLGAVTVSRLQITLGTQSAAARTARGVGSMIWTPGTALADPAGNAVTATPVAETGAADADF